MDDGSGFLPMFPLLVLTRGAHFASLFVLFGAPLFWLCADGAFPRARATTDGLLRLSGAVAALSGFVWIVCVVANMAGGFDKVAEPETLSLFFSQAPFGPAAAIRMILLAAALVLAGSHASGGRRLVAFLVVGALLLIDQAWLGHAAEGAGTRGALMILVYCAHVLAAAAWLGGLPPLFFALREAQAGRDGSAEASVLLSFSRIALPAVALMALSGAGNAGFHVGSPVGRLLLSDYGLVLCAKAALVAAMLVLAAYNRFVALPGLQARPGFDERLASRLRASVAAEAALGLAVLGAAAILGVTPPP
jgi:copper resistance protein D